MRNLLFIVILTLLCFSCRKYDGFIQKDAVINWTGNYEVDGCGFFVFIDGQKFKPDNEKDIANEFKDSNINISIFYKETTKQVADGCYTAGPTFTDRIYIKSIKRR